MGTGALVGGALTKPETAYSAAMDTIAAREASAYGIIDAKLQADAARQLGNQELAAQKFQQSLYLQEQRQMHDMMLTQARAEAHPRNQPMSGAGLFDPMSAAQMAFGGPAPPILVIMPLDFGDFSGYYNRKIDYDPGINLKFRPAGGSSGFYKAATSSSGDTEKKGGLEQAGGILKDVFANSEKRRERDAMINALRERVNPLAVQA